MSTKDGQPLFEGNDAVQAPKQRKPWTNPAVILPTSLSETEGNSGTGADGGAVNYNLS